MKKTLTVLMMVLLAAMLIVSCDNAKEPAVYKVTFDSKGGTSVEAVTVKEGEKITGVKDPTKGGFDFVCWTKDGAAFNLDTDVVTEDMTLVAKWSYKTYAIGDTGPAGGIIYYDVDADNDDEENDGAGTDKLKSSECGWRYLEAAKEIVKLEDGTTGFIFGYYIVEGKDAFIWPGKGRDAFGAGRDITKKIVDTLGETACSDAAGTTTTSNYAARVASRYNGGGYTDWFLPSTYEAVEMKDVPELNLTIWTCSESTATASTIAPTSGMGDCSTVAKSNSYPVRPVRRF